MEINTLVIGSMALLTLLAGLSYSAHRRNQKLIRNLRLIQESITEKDLSLQLLLNERNQLLTDKEHLVTEKQRLLREVLHRVNNNLQIVLSLVNTQTYYLEEGPALDAIRESRNQVQSISLIHQKLYPGPNISSIGMLSFAGELIEDLRNSFGEKTKRISFEYYVDDISINVDQAIPIGLILNESITNAIKYAFPQRKGKIIVILKRIGPDTLLLKICDNGIGLPDRPDIQHIDTAGWQIIR